MGTEPVKAAPEKSVKGNFKFVKTQSKFENKGEQLIDPQGILKEKKRKFSMMRKK